MGTLSLSKTGRLFWLGRYTERVLTTIRATKWIYDHYVDGEECDYDSYCTRLGIPDVYMSTGDFCERYLKDGDCLNSIHANMNAAYDNAIVLRDTIGTDTFSYIQLACNAMEKAVQSYAPEVELQWVVDDIMAFRGSCDLEMLDEGSRSIIRTGSSLERVDLYIRLGYDKDRVRAECNRLLNRLYKAPIKPDQTVLDRLVDALLDETLPDVTHGELLRLVESLFPDL